MSLNEPAVAITAAANRLATMTVRGLNSSGEAAVLDSSLIFRVVDDAGRLEVGTLQQPRK